MEQSPRLNHQHEASTADLVKSALDEARTLVRLEVELAKRDARSELAHLKTGAIAFGVAGVTAILGLALLLVAIVLATGGEWTVALAIGGALLVFAGISAFIGAGVLPKKPFDRTRHRLEHDVRELKEHVA